MVCIYTMHGFKGNMTTLMHIIRGLNVPLFEYSPIGRKIWTK